MSRRPLITSGLKRRLKPLYFRGKRRLVRAFRSYGAAELEAALRGLGVCRGDCLFVHAGFDQFNGFEGNAGDCVDALLRALGPDGHVLMVSMAYRGASEAFARSGAVFDAVRTPSAMGLLSEVFRGRRDGVCRSLSPLHPVLAIGPKARWLVADHDQLSRSCGPGSPFERFLRLDGKVLFLDAPFSALTFMHYVEDAVEDCLPFELYGDETIPITVRGRDGTERVVRQRLFSEAIRARRTFDVVERELVRNGEILERRLGNTRLVLANAGDIFERGRQVAARGPGGLYN